ncbi:CTLH/CRA C-terminal to lish motif domain-containing protein [Lentinula raphanica]|nr:CTLH/CRA C-terminal to lish motif domain-containing protein [Lentinula raphanica]
MSSVESDTLQATPVKLHSIVLNYLAHNGYSRTARAFTRDSAVRQIDIDGDELIQPEAASGLGSNSESDSRLDTTLKQAELRNQIRAELRHGRIDQATALINQSFPDVLSLSNPLRSEDTLVSSSKMDYLPLTSVLPSHLVLNLRIQSFIEACRTTPLPCPADCTIHDPPSSSTSLPTSTENPDPIDDQTALLNSAQKLYALVKLLPSEEDSSRYMKELESVIGLLAYHVPEESPVSEYLAQERRDAVANQLDHAILYHTKRPVISYLELYVRYTSTVWDILNNLGVKPPSSLVVSPPTAKTTSHIKGAQELQGHEISTSFNFRDFVNSS